MIDPDDDYYWEPIGSASVREEPYCCDCGDTGMTVLYGRTAFIVDGQPGPAHWRENGIEVTTVCTCGGGLEREFTSVTRAAIALLLNPWTDEPPY